MSPRTWGDVFLGISLGLVGGLVLAAIVATVSGCDAIKEQAAREEREAAEMRKTHNWVCENTGGMQCYKMGGFTTCEPTQRCNWVPKGAPLREAAPMVVPLMPNGVPMGVMH